MVLRKLISTNYFYVEIYIYIKSSSVFAIISIFSYLILTLHIAKSFMSLSLLKNANYLRINKFMLLVLNWRNKVNVFKTKFWSKKWALFFGNSFILIDLAIIM